MTPKSINEKIKEFVSLVCPGEEPYFVEVNPEEYAQVSFCFQAVAEKVRRDGGEELIGWQIWDLGYMIEAEFHAIWESPSGMKLDVTPKSFPAEQILFLHDRSRRYEGKQVDNIRLNVVGSRLVDDLIKVREVKYFWLNKGDLADKSGEIHLCGKDAEMFSALSLIEKGIIDLIKNREPRNCMCFCGRDLKYKNCHGKDVKEIHHRFCDSH